MLATTLSVALSIFIIKLHYQPPLPLPPEWLRTFVFGYLARFVRMDHGKRLSSLVAKKPPVCIALPEETDEHCPNSPNTTSTTTMPNNEHFELLNDARRRKSRCLRSPTSDAASTAGEVDEPNEWKLIAQVLDRLFFITFLIILLVPTSIILGFVRLLKPKL